MTDTDLPFSKEAEIAILGAMVIDEDAINTALEHVQPEYFYINQNRLIFNAIREIYDRGEDVDVITISDQLESRDQLDGAGGMSYLAQLVDAVPSTHNLKSHINILFEKYQRRSLIQSAHEIIDEAYDAESGSMDDVLDRSENRIFSISEEFDSDGPYRIRGVLDDTMEEIDRRINSDNVLIGLQTGLTKLDRNTGGLKPSELVVVAGRPSMGKTAFAVNVAQSAAVEQGIPTAIFSLEMAKNELTKRILSSRARVNGMKLQNGDLNEREIERLAGAAEEVDDSPLFVDDNPALSLVELRAKARRLKKKEDLGLVLVDYLQLMSGSRAQDKRYLEVGEMSRGAKIMARELDLPVILISQLSRAPEMREDHRPRLADLRESGDIEQDADIVLFIFRQEVYDGPRSKDGEDLTGKAEIIIGKQRNGPVGKVETHFIPEFTRFEGV